MKLADSFDQILVAFVFLIAGIGAWFLAQAYLF